MKDTFVAHRAGRTTAVSRVQFRPPTNFSQLSFLISPRKECSGSHAPACIGQYAFFDDGTVHLLDDVFLLQQISMSPPTMVSMVSLARLGGIRRK